MFINFSLQQKLPRQSVVGQIVVALIGAQLLFFASFSALTLPTGNQKNLIHYANCRLRGIAGHLPASNRQWLLTRFPSLTAESGPVRYSLYVPEIPISIFLGYVLGPLLGPLSCLGFIFAGVVGPCLGIYPFASGGGVDYFREPAFGYLLGLVVASWSAGRLAGRPRTTVSQLLVVGLGVAAAHAVGLTCMMASYVVQMILGHSGNAVAWGRWIFEEARNLSWYPLPYDIVFSLVLVALGFPFQRLAGLLTGQESPIKPKSEPPIEESA